jgi:multiple sugar transport system substrate-binding protein
MKQFSSARKPPRIKLTGIRCAVFCAALCVTLISCGAKRHDAKVADAAPAAGAGNGETVSPDLFSVRDRIPLKVVYFDTETEDNTRWLTTAVSSFEKSHPTVKVILSPIYGNETDYANKLSLTLKSDSTIDIILFDGAQLHAYISSGFLVGFMADTWDEWITKFPGKTKDTVSFNGLDYAMPISVETQGLFYNSKVFARAGIPVPWKPETWDDIEDAAKKLKPIVEYPLWLSGSSAQPEATALQTFGSLLSGTGDWLYENKQWVTASKGMLDSLAFLGRIYQKDAIMDNLPRSVMLSRHSLDTLARKLNAGEIGILLHSCNLGPAILRTTTEYKNTIMVTPMPCQNGGSTSVTGSWMLGISNLSANKFISFEFLKSALSKETQTVSCTLRGDIPVRRDVEASEEWRTENWYANKMSDYLYFSRFRPEGPEYPQVSRLVSIAVESVINGAATPEAAMRQFTADMETIVPESRRVRKPFK